MINKILHSASSAANLTSHHIGLLHTKAYRILNQETAKALKQYNITPVDWAFIGLLFEAKTELRLSEAAEELGVEAPFITERSQELIKINLIRITVSKSDKRVKFIKLTSKARRLIPDIERTLITAMRPLLVGSSLKEILGYKRVLEAIVKNKPQK